MTDFSFLADHYAPGTHHPPHQHDALQISLVLSGQVRESVGAVTEHASALSVVIKAAGVVHTDHFGPSGARLVRLTCPLTDLSAVLDDARRGTEWRWTHDPHVAAPFLRLVQRYASPRTTGRLARCVADDDPDLMDLLAALTARPAHYPPGTAPAWLTDTLGALPFVWQPHWRVGDVARQAGVHPVYLARCVRRWFGVGVADLLRSLRLRAAVTHCVEAGRTVSDAAHAAGFSDEAHFNRTLRAATGLSPGRYRDLVSTFARTVPHA